MFTGRLPLCGDECFGGSGGNAEICVDESGHRWEGVGDVDPRCRLRDGDEERVRYIGLARERFDVTTRSRRTRSTRKEWKRLLQCGQDDSVEAVKS